MGDGWLKKSEMSIDELLNEAAVKAQEEAEKVKNLSCAEKTELLHSNGKTLAVDLLQNSVFLAKCTQVLGGEKVELMKKRVFEDLLMSSSSLEGPQLQVLGEKIEKVIEDYDAPHLRPTEKWKEGGPSCWSCWNLVSYCGNIQ